jgi:uncharacterized protein (TIGR00251 family)
MLKQTKDGILIPIKVIPNASKNVIIGWENEALKVRINAAPEKGAANSELITFLAKRWKLPKTSFSLHSGETSRQKKVLVQGVTLEALLQKITLSIED